MLHVMVTTGRHRQFNRTLAVDCMLREPGLDLAVGGPGAQLTWGH